MTNPQTDGAGEWSVARKNLKDLVEKYPSQLENAIDSAYVAGLDELSHREKLAEERGFTEGRLKTVDEAFEKRRDSLVKDATAAETRIVGILKKFSSITHGGKTCREVTAKPSKWCDGCTTVFALLNQIENK